MFLSILGITALEVLGYNSLKDDESRVKTKAIIARTIERTEKNLNKKFNNGELDNKKEEEFLKFEENFNKNQSNFIKWKIDADMLKFKKDTGYTEESIKYQRKLEDLQHKYFKY